MTAKAMGLLTAVLVLGGCEREVVGETYENQLHGDRALEVTEESPPAGALAGDHVPETRPDYDRAPLLPDGNDPAYRGMLLAAGAHFPEPPPVRRIVAPPAPVPVPLPVIEAEPAPQVPAPPVPAVPPAAIAPVRPALRVAAPRPAPPPVVPAPAPAPADPAPAPAPP